MATMRLARQAMAVRIIGLWLAGGDLRRGTGGRDGAAAAAGSSGSVHAVRHRGERAAIDQYILLIHPVVLGIGRRLFADGILPAKLALVDSEITTTGVIIATCRPATG